MAKTRELVRRRKAIANIKKITRTMELIATAMRVAHQGSPPLARAARMARAAFGGVAEFRKWAASHCDVARLLGARMGLPGQVQQALRHLYERWDGNGMPGELCGTQIPLPVRLMQVAQDADVTWQHGGAELVRSKLAERAGSGLDPEAVKAFLAAGDRLVEPLGLTSARWQVIGAVSLAGQPQTVPSIARAMGLTRQAVQRLVNELVADGLIEGRPNPAHRRANLFALTDLGEAAVADASARQAPAKSSSGFDDMDDDIPF